MKIKESYSNYDALSHAWASQNAERGHTRGNRMFFEGPSIYSYGHHFEIARYVKVGKKSVVLFTSRDYSPTTSKHKSAARSAVSHQEVFTVESFDDHNGNVDAYLESIASALDSLKRARTRIVYTLTNIQNAIKRAHNYAVRFKASITTDRQKRVTYWLRKSKKLLTADELENLYKREKTHKDGQERREEQRRERWRRASAERQAQHEKYQREQAEKEALDRANLSADIERWKQGENPDNTLLRNTPIMLRIKDDEIETSASATVPLIEARKFWNALQRRENVVGMRLGLYTVDALDGSILKVGCHDIPVKEVYRMARLLQWNDDAMVIQ